MQRTEVQLGEGTGYIVKPKAKYKPIKTGFCRSPTCLCEVQLDDRNRCLRCFNVVIRSATYESLKKRFEAFLKHNEKILSHFIFDNPESENLKIPVMIGRKFHYVPLRYFLEFQDICNTNEYIDDHEKALESFFSYIKQATESG